MASYRSILQPDARRRQSGFGRIAKVGFDRLAAALALLIRHETTATLWLSISSKLVWMQQTAGS
jgi:hypothetical protein